MRKVKVFILGILSSMVLSGCFDVPEKLIAPEWDVDLNVPLVSRIYTINEIIGAQANLEVQQDSIYLLHTREYTQARDLLEFIRLREAINQDNLFVRPVNDTRDFFMDFRNDVVLIDSAVFDEGFINLNLRNRSSLPVSFLITVPGISLNGTVLVMSIQMSPGEITQVSQDLNGYKYSEPPNQPVLFRNTLWVIAQSQASGTNTGGNVEFDIQISDFNFSSVSGRFSEQDIGNRTDTIDAEIGTDISDFRGKITLASATLNLTTRYISRYSNPFSLRVDSLTILARSNEQEIYLTDSTGSRFINFILSEGNITLNFTESNSNIIDIINSIPDHFIISESFRILGNNESGTISNEDVADISMEINTRSILAVGKSTITDTLGIEISQKNREDIRNAQFSSLNLEVTNAVPVKGWVKVDFLDSLYRPTFSVRVENSDSLILEGASVSLQTGDVTSPSFTFKSVELTKEDIDDFADSYFMVLTVSVETSAYNSTDPPLVAIRAGDWVKVLSYGTVKYRIKDL
jgi:hypothetical protein